MKAPVLILHRKEDPLDTTAELRETFPKAQVVLLENAGHFPWVEQPEAFFAPLSSFLAHGANCH
jgi:proline iminopeptidase